MAAAKRKSAQPRKSTTRHRDVFGPPINAAYDAAQTTTHNSRHWASATSLSANAELSPSVRQTIRDRARLEARNNPYLSGILETLANDMVGTGPRLQLDLHENPADNNRVEQLFSSWMRATQFALKLRTAVKAKATDGEAIFLPVDNNRIALQTGGITLDVQLVECDRLGSGFDDILHGRLIDGIDLDEAGFPVRYHIATSHPGDYGIATRFVPHSADRVIHWFKRDRPEQQHGVCEFASALESMAIFRRFVLATLSAAENAANHAAILKTTIPFADFVSDIEPFSTVEISRNAMPVMPDGFDLAQLRSEHPASTFEMFRRSSVAEFARPFGMPFCVAAADSAGYNYASGRLDFQVYDKNLAVGRFDAENIVLHRVFEWWWEEASLIPGYLPADAILDFSRIRTMWDGRPHVDPKKEAEARKIRLETMTSTLSEEYARDGGRDWESSLVQIAREKQRMQELGLSMTDVVGGKDAGPANTSEDEDDDE